METNIKGKILKLKKEKDAIILAHYYQRPEIQEIADEVGDSYYLSCIAKDCSQKVIVFCGVKFMAESAKILSPEKTVLLPVIDAGCPMAEMADADEVIKMKEKHPDAAIVCYINSTTEVKAVSDVCCTSSNALKIINNIEKDEIIFLPDKNLAEYIQAKVTNKRIILWNGFCVTHKKVRKDEVLKAKELHENIEVLVHPECEGEIRDLADYIGSTGQIIDYASKSSNKKFLIVTEEGVFYELKKRNPDKEFYIPSGSMTCMNMKKTTLEDVYESLNNLKYEINIDEDIRVKASNALMNMHRLAR